MNVNSHRDLEIPKDPSYPNLDLRRQRPWPLVNGIERSGRIRGLTVQCNDRCRSAI